jgi:putative flippase GtrA
MTGDSAAAPLVSRFLMFAVVGMSSTAVTSMALWVLHAELRWAVPLAATAAYALGMLLNFSWNNRWTFSCSNWSGSRFLRFCMIALTGLGLNVAVVTGLADGVHMALLQANVAAVTVSMWWNFWTNVVWTWPQRRGAAGAAPGTGIGHG